MQTRSKTGITNSTSDKSMQESKNEDKTSQNPLKENLGSDWEVREASELSGTSSSIAPDKPQRTPRSENSNAEVPPRDTNDIQPQDAVLKVREQIPEHVPRKILDERKNSQTEISGAKKLHLE